MDLEAEWRVALEPGDPGLADFAEDEGFAFVHEAQHAWTKCQPHVRFVRAMNKTERLFALAEHLRARRTGVTAEQLAERFGVTIRTIYRDLDALRAAHLPLGA